MKFIKLLHLLTSTCHICCCKNNNR